MNITRRSALRTLAGAAAVAVGAGAGAGVGAGVAHASGTAGPQRLRDELGGKVLFPGDPGYDAERAAFNTIVDQHPNAIVVAQTACDVEAAVAIGAGQLGWPVALQTTGHGISVPADNALLINMREMNGVTVDTVRQTARIEGGALWSDVLAASAPSGLLPPVGSTSGVGATGYTTGGGVPINGRSYGYAADRVRGIELVTPDGRRRHLSPDRESDLFWAVRGGESNFGAVTAFEIELTPITAVYGGVLTFPAAAADHVFREYVSWTATTPDEMTTGAVFIQIPSAPQLLQIQVVYAGPAADGADVLAPLRALNPIADSVTVVPIAEVDSIYHVPSTPGPVTGASRFISRLDADGLDLLLETVGFGAGLPAGTVQFRQLGGQFARPPAAANPLGYRDAGFLLYLANLVPDPGLLPSVEQAEQAAMARLEPILTAGTVPTFLGPFDTSPQAVSTAYDPAAWSRLREIKRRHDPDNLFRINHNIR